MQMGKKIKMCGSTVDSILDIVDEYNYDFIVLGSHGKKRIAKMVRLSVTRNCFCN